jgi:uncharacterized lipoprotein YajG
MKLIVAIAVLSLAACATPTGYGQAVAPPAPWLMQSPSLFPKMKPGDDARETLARSAKSHARNRAQVKGLQRYVRTVRGLK